MLDAALTEAERTARDAEVALAQALAAQATEAAEARVAEAALAVLAAATIGEFEAVHGRIEGSELVVLGLGRMGGGALTHASDLDLVYVGNETDLVMYEGSAKEVKVYENYLDLLDKHPEAQIVTVVTPCRTDSDSDGAAMTSAS